MICHNFVIQYSESTSLYLSCSVRGANMLEPLFLNPMGMLDAYLNPFIYSQLATTELSSRYFWQVITGPTPPFPSLFIFFKPHSFNNYKQTGFSDTTWKVKVYPHPKMQSCTHKNKQWPSLSSMAKAILPRQPGLIFNLVHFLWAVPPLSSSYVCELHSQETLKLLRSQGTKTDWLATSLETHTMLLTEREKKKEWVRWRWKKRQ